MASAPFRPAVSVKFNSCTMLVDDGHIFPEPQSGDPPSPLAVLQQMYARQPSAHKLEMDLVEEMARAGAKELGARLEAAAEEGGENSEDTHDLILDRDGHRRRSGYLSEQEGTTAFWALQTTPGEPIGQHSASFVPALSPPCRARLLDSLEHDVPVNVIDELRRLARSDAHTGISAWRSVREREREQAGRAANERHRDKV